MLSFRICVKYLCGILEVFLKILHKIPDPYIEIYVFDTILDIRANIFLNTPLLK